MNRLLEIGFEPVGHWLLEDDKLSLELLRYTEQKNILYAFVSDGQVKYVGKTVRTLASRMMGYRIPGSTQITNIRNSANIKKLLADGAAVEVLALPDNGLLHYGQFHINLAAALEDDIIRVVNPEWNGGKCEPQGVELPQGRGTSDEQTQGSVLNEVQVVQGLNESFRKAAVNASFQLRPTYAKTGFFNVSVDVAKFFGADGEKIEIFCGEGETPVIGSINRRANNGGTPRIMGGVGLKRWFEQVAQIDQKISLSILTPTIIHLEV